MDTGHIRRAGISLLACFVAEVVLTFFFLLVILGSTDVNGRRGFDFDCDRAVPDADPPDFRIPVTNTSVNPARSTGPAIFVGGWAVGQLWLFWVAPIVGAALAGFIYSLLFAELTRASCA